MRFFPYLNLSLLILIAISGLTFFLFSSSKAQIEEDTANLVEEIALPKNPFKQKKEAYEGWENGSLALNWVAPKLTLPDLSTEISYFGCNHRPDCEKGKTKMRLGFQKKGETITALSGEKLYLKYQSGLYSFQDSRSPLWLEVTPIDRDGAEFLEVKVFLKDEENTLITTPNQNHLFSLKAEEKKGTPQLLDIGGYRADASLLLRQGARLSGFDVFLQKHGGEEFKDSSLRERLDFINGDEIHYCFIKEGDFLIWKESWVRPSENESTENYPLIFVKKIDDKAISMELWDIEGKHKIPLTLLRAKNYDPPLDLSQEFKFVGAKTWVECIVECHNKRFLLKEGDWVILTQEGWHKIESEEEVDNYVNQKLVGPLFVLDKILKKNGRTVLAGHLFNTSRTTVTDVELVSEENVIKTELTE